MSRPKCYATLIAGLATLSLLLVLVACSDSTGKRSEPSAAYTPDPTPTPTYDVEEARAELAAARDIWESKGSEDYTVEYFVQLGPWREPLQLTVRNGVIESATLLEGRDSGMPAPPYIMSDVLTIDGLFDKIEATLSRITPAWNMGAEYDAEFGYPRHFGVTYSITAADNYFAAGFCCYTPLAPPSPTAAPETSSLSQRPEPGDEVLDLCNTPVGLGIANDMAPPSRGDWTMERYIRWSPDGSRILFSSLSPGLWSSTTAALYSIDPDAVSLLKVVNASEDGSTYDLRGYYPLVREIVDAPDRDPVWGDGSPTMYFDVSPDSSRIVYSTCAYTEAAEQDVRRDEWGQYYEIVVSDIRDTRNAERKEGGRLWVYNSEIVASDIDGTNVKRLTKNVSLDNFPAWSPDGAKVALISTTEPSGIEIGPRVDKLTFYEVATGESEQVALPPGVSAHPHRLAWSPNGEYVAFIASSYDSGAPRFETLGLYLVRTNGSGVPVLFGRNRVWYAASGPAWSPDGRRIAMIVTEPDGAALYAFAVDGSGAARLSDDLPEPWHFPVYPWFGDLSWSPDGSEILLKGFTHRVPLDGSAAIGSPLTDIPSDAAWSPDGSMIAIRADEILPKREGTDGPLVYIMDRDGTNVRALVERFGTEVGLAWSPERLALGIGSCSISATVPASDEPPPLLQDCETLLNVRDALGVTTVPLNWSYEVPVTGWDGVTINWSPLRVSGLELHSRGLIGPIPPELGNLTGLRELDLSYNDLSGPIPPYLGNLTGLTELDLSYNDLSGPIPPDLGNLTGLANLNLSGNSLTGCVLAELHEMWVHAGLERCGSGEKPGP